MPETKRQQIVNKIVERMQTIRTADGFQTDIGTDVFDWETDFQENELPAMSVCDLSERVSEIETEQIDEAFEIYRLPVQIRIFKSSDQRASDARKYIADVYQAIRSDKTWSGLAFDTEHNSSEFVMAEDGFSLVGVAVNIEIIFYTKQFNAYE